jgi:ComF family protein
LQRDKPSAFETACHRCDEHFYDRARAMGVYESALSASVLHLKKHPVFRKRLRNLFVNSFFETPFQDSSRILPVPLSKRRLIERGFNQAAILGKALSKQTGIFFDDKSLTRTKHSGKHRPGMDKKGRRLSVDNSFAVNVDCFVKDENILLVDDVFTSGATVSECAKTLKKNGAGRVYVYTLARTV